jgi:hypothetical protein
MKMAIPFQVSGDGALAADATPERIFHLHNSKNLLSGPSGSDFRLMGWQSWIWP